MTNFNIAGLGNAFSQFGKIAGQALTNAQRGDITSFGQVAHSVGKMLSALGPLGDMGNRMAKKFDESPAPPQSQPPSSPPQGGTLDPRTGRWDGIPVGPGSTATSASGLVAHNAAGLISDNAANLDALRKLTQGAPLTSSAPLKGSFGVQKLSQESSANSESPVGRKGSGRNMHTYG